MEKMEYNKLYNMDCMNYFSIMGGGLFDLTLTDIPYGVVNRDSNGLRNLDKNDADIMTFNLHEFLEEIYRITKSTIIIFCAKEQLSEIYSYFSNKQKAGKGTVRQIIWEKSNPSPMNGQNIYLSGIENAVWFKKRGGTFNAHCKNTVFRYPCGRNKIHPTEKNHSLLKELILDNSNVGDIVFDPCMGSGSSCLVAAENDRKYVDIELKQKYYDLAVQRIQELQ